MKRILPIEEEELDQLLDLALAEDIGRGDLTSLYALDKDTQVTFVVRTRQAMTASGISVVMRLIERFEDEIYVNPTAEDGTQLEANANLLKGQGNAQCVFMIERVILNILQHMGGIATHTRKFVDAVSDTSAVIVDTRKTTPGLRLIEKMAVVDGGGRNHRMRLDDGVLLKDNHLSLLKRPLKESIAIIRESLPLLTAIEVECESLSAVKEALAAGADIIMLDNMGLKEMEEAVKFIDDKVPIEASGNVSLDNVAAIAKTGVDYISIGKLTHSSPAVDIGLDVIG